MFSAFKKRCSQTRQISIWSTTTDYSKKYTQAIQHMEEQQSSSTKLSLTKNERLPLHYKQQQQTTITKFNSNKESWYLFTSNEALKQVTNANLSQSAEPLTEDFYKKSNFLQNLVYHWQRKKNISTSHGLQWLLFNPQYNSFAI